MSMSMSDEIETIFGKIPADWLEREREAKEQIDKMSDEMKEFIYRPMYLVIGSYWGCLSVAEDYGNDVDSLKKDWYDFICDYYLEDE